MKKKHHFSSVTDEVLFNRAIKHTKEINKPYFITLSTVTGHPPFVNPDTGKISEEETFRYTDTQLANFYNNLEKNNFFDNGILIITSDHRSMTPISEKELNMFGTKAASLVPLIIVDKSKSNNRYDILSQQSDLLNSVKGMISGCDEITKSNFLSEKVRAAKCVYHQRGDNRDMINVFCSEQSGSVKLKGDDTFLVSGDLENSSKAIDYINYNRILQSKRQNLFIEGKNKKGTSYEICF